MKRSVLALACVLMVASCLSAQARQTGHLTFEERGEVIGRLYRLGLENKPEHIPVFCKALKDKSSMVREAAIAQLVFTHDKSAIKPVIAVMEDRSRRVRRCAIAVLERIGSKKAIPALKKALTYRPPGYRESERLRHEEHFNRLGAAIALHRLGSKAGRGTVLEALKTPSHKSAQTMALKAVILMNMKEATPECIRIARGWEFFGEDSPGLFALRALWHVGDRKRRKEIVKVALEKNDAIGMHARIWTLALMVKFGDEDVTDVFKKVISTARQDEYQYQCILGLEKFKPEGAAELIVKRIIPPRSINRKTGGINWPQNYKIFKLGCTALGTLGDKSVIPQMKDWLKRYSKPEDHFFYRLHLAWALARLSDAEGADHLNEALTHDDAAVRRIAAKLLGKLGNKKSVPMLVTAFKKETEPYTFEVIKRSIGKLVNLPGDVKGFPTPAEAPAPTDTYGKFRYMHLWFDDCATIEAMERFSEFVEELAAHDVRWAFKMMVAPLSRHDHEYNMVLLQRLFDRGCEIGNHSLHHNPDGRGLRGSTDDQLRAEIGGCNNWLHTNIKDLDKIYSWYGGGGAFRRPGDPVRPWRDITEIARECRFARDVWSWPWKGNVINPDMFAPPFHMGPRAKTGKTDRPRLVSRPVSSDLHYAYDADTPEERIRAFSASFDWWYFNRPGKVMNIGGHDWPNSSIPDRPGNEMHWEILSGFLRDVLLTKRDRYPLARAVTALELAHIYNKKADLADLITRKVHLQTDVK